MDHRERKSQHYCSLVSLDSNLTLLYTGPTLFHTIVMDSGSYPPLLSPLPLIPSMTPTHSFL